MNTNNIIAVVAVIAIAIAFVNLSVTLMKTDEFEKLTGFGVLRGSVNITIISFRDINFTRPEINFSYGSLDAGVGNATLYTTGAGTPVIARGNWSTAVASAKGLILENIGSVNSSVVIASGVNATQLFAGTAAERAYKWNISNKETGSCTGGTLTFSIFNDVNQSTKVCSQFSSLTASNEIYIDLLLSIPYDTTASSTVGDTITATAGVSG